MKFKNIAEAVAAAYLAASCAASPTANPTQTAHPTSGIAQAPTETITQTPWPMPSMPSGALQLNLNFPTFAQKAHWVPDPGIAVGKSIIIVTSNDYVAIYKKNGALVTKRLLGDMFIRLRQTNQDDPADPRIVFDSWSQRFFLFTRAKVVDPFCKLGECKAQFLLAASKSDDPTTLTETDWYTYALDATIDVTNQGTAPTRNWPDFTSLGVSKDAVILTVRMLDRSFVLQDNADLAANPQQGIVALDPDVNAALASSDCYERTRIVEKSALLSGGPIVTWHDFKSATCSSYQVAINDEASADAIFLVNSSSGTPCIFDIRHVQDPVGSPKIDDVRFMVQSCVPGNAIPQPHGDSASDKPQLSGDPELIDHPVYRNGSLWIARETSQRQGGVETSAILFLQLDVSNWPKVKLVQSAVIAQPGIWYFKPAITVNAQDDVAITFACTDGIEPISICYTGRLGTDVLNSIRPSVKMKAGGIDDGSNFDRCHRDRWGDYFGAALDPVDGSAWIVGQYASGPCWATWVGNLDWRVVP